MQAAVILPFFTASRGILDVTLDDTLDDWVVLLAFAEGMLGVILVFLIGLALRNRFRI